MGIRALVGCLVGTALDRSVFTRSSMNISIYKLRKSRDVFVPSCVTLFVCSFVTLASVRFDKLLR